ncbi:hypothetical protein HaLaN_08769, partial [Haematococcus lacustris]
MEKKMPLMPLTSSVAVLGFTCSAASRGALQHEQLSQQGLLPPLPGLQQWHVQQCRAWAAALGAMPVVAMHWWLPCSVVSSGTD